MDPDTIYLWFGTPFVFFFTSSTTNQTRVSYGRLVSTTPPLCQRTPRLEWRRVSAIRVWVHLFHDLLLFVQEVALRGFICSCWLACGIAIDPFIPSQKAYTGEILNIRQCAIMFRVVGSARQTFLHRRQVRLIVFCLKSEVPACLNRFGRRFSFGTMLAITISVRGAELC